MSTFGFPTTRGTLLVGLAVSFALGQAVPARAVLLDPGDVVALPGTTSAAEPQLAGVVVVDEIIPFSFLSGGGTIMGTVQQRIVRSDLDGTLDFYWRVVNDADSSGAIGSFRVGEFVSPEYNANYRTDGLGDVGPEFAVRFASPIESYVNFEFSTLGILPGQSSLFMFFDTTATHYARTAIFDVTNVGQTSISGLFDAYSPATVPEPGSAALLGLALLGVAVRARRSR